MILHQVLSIITWAIGLVNILALASISITILAILKLISNKPFLVSFLIMFNPPITFILMWCFLLSSVIMTIIFSGFLSVDWPQLKDLFFLNSVYIIYNIAYFYLIGFVIPKM